MKQLKRISGLVSEYPVFTLATLAGAIALVGVALMGDRDAGRQPVKLTAAATAPRAPVNPNTVSPFGAMPPAGVHPAAVRPAPLPTQAAFSRVDALLAAPALALSSADERVAYAPEAARHAAESESQTAAPQSVVAPADMKPAQPPRLYVASVAEPSDIDADGQNASAALPPTQVQVPTDAVATRDAQNSKQALDLAGITPAAATSTVTVYTPAQIRQAYGFAALPAGTAANKSAYQGSGQIIVILDAFHNATAGADLNTFSAKFGLPQCTLIPTTYKAGTPIASLVTKPRAGEGCSFQVLYANSSGGQAAKPPAVNAAWATEIALDVQWVHAMAPMAKIVLVEAASNSGGDLMNAMLFASKLGGSAISMSFGAPEFSSGPAYDWVMGGTGVTWVAASGDNGAGVSWPASSANVLGVGGTLLTNVSPRAESGWSGSGGGRSAYVVMPAWQSSVTIAGNPAKTAANATKMRRGVPDVAYNASPYSGFYVYQTGRGYLNVGGTSAGTPQWAALVGIVNGVRALNGKTAFTGTGFQQAMYGSVAATLNYRSTLLDVTTGANGTCSSCLASIGYDLVTGLGSPNVPGVVGVMAALK